MASSSSRSRNVAREHQDESHTSGGIRCGCQALVRIYQSNTATNPGRRFLRCPNYKDATKCCNYFQWIDAKEVKHDDVVDGSFDYKKELQKFMEESGRNQQVILLYSRCMLLLIGMVLILVVVLLKSC